MAQPAMMAIGDSLFNGVRSLTINQPLAQWSAPAQVARAFSIPFVTPDYPRNVVMNFEHWLGGLLPDPVGIALDVQNNIEFWDGQPKSALPEFDNVAIASAAYSDLWDRTAATAQADIDQLHGQLGDNFSQMGDQLANLFFDFNTRFLLNPQASATTNLSQLDIVTARLPQRLLVSIGANNGLWEMGFAAAASSGVIGVPGDGPFSAADIGDLATLVGKLQALPAGIQHIYFNALPLPSMVADMMPVPDVSDTAKPGPGNYYSVYENSFGWNYGTLTAAQMKLNDTTVGAVNAKLAELVAGDLRIHVVPIDQAFAAYDFKTNGAANTVQVAGKVLSNLMLEGPTLPFFPNLWRGGLMGLDGMHPTIVGYAIMAEEIVKTITQFEGLAPVAPIDVAQAYQVDTLLQNVPASWDLVLDLSLDIRRGLASAANQAPTSAKYVPVTQLLNALQFKYD